MLCLVLAGIFLIGLVACSYKKLPADMSPGMQILCADGSIVLEVLSADVKAGTVRARCLNNATLGYTPLLLFQHSDLDHCHSIVILHPSMRLRQSETTLHSFCLNFRHRARAEESLECLSVVKYLEKGIISCGMLSSEVFYCRERKNVNLPGVVVDLPTLTKKDEVDLVNWGIPNDIDFIAASFVRKGQDLDNIRKVCYLSNDPHSCNSLLAVWFIQCDRLFSYCSM